MNKSGNSLHKNYKGDNLYPIILIILDIHNMQAFITRGCFTNHGGKIIEGDDFWLVDGKAAHLEGMKHYCPKCNVISKAIATQRGFMQVNGRNLIVAGDQATCGAKYMKISDLAVRTGGSGSGASSGQASNVQNIIDQLNFDERVQLIDRDDNEPLANIPYHLKDSTGSVVASGTTDENGYTERFHTTKAEDIHIFIGELE
ncbi:MULTISPECIES: PAAR domain-containing protein [Acinetobacter]|uniref:PAAR domain-containing protein n=2 Tax=Moraxellaceae TaxID=468 RepID=UPI0021D03883|nr:PAAR domain-containing protein [Acinetobacter gyllenbergii]